jgi:hypothetical protein
MITPGNKLNGELHLKEVVLDKKNVLRLQNERLFKRISNTFLGQCHKFHNVTVITNTFEYVIEGGIIFYYCTLGQKHKFM